MPAVHYFPWYQGYPNIPRKESRQSLRAIAQSPSRNNSGLTNLRWLADVSGRRLDELSENLRSIDEHVASLEHDARQPRLAMVADVSADTKTRECTEGAAAVVQAMHGDSFSANRVGSDPEDSTRFGDDSTGPPTVPYSRDDALVSNGAVAAKPCLLPLEIRTKTAPGTTSTATKTTIHQLPLLLYSSEKITTAALDA